MNLFIHLDVESYPEPSNLQRSNHDHQDLNRGGIIQTWVGITKKIELVTNRILNKIRRHFLRCDERKRSIQIEAVSRKSLDLSSSNGRKQMEKNKRRLYGDVVQANEKERKRVSKMNQIEERTAGNVSGEREMMRVEAEL